MTIEWGISYHIFILKSVRIEIKKVIFREELI